WSGVIAVGSLNESVAHPREMLRALQAVGESTPLRRLLIAHNHPSGDPRPSSADLRMTARLQELSRMMGYDVVDHVITDGDKFSSLLEQGAVPDGEGYHPFPADGTQAKAAPEFKPSKAPWEAVKRGDLGQITSDVAAEKFIADLRSDPAHGHLIYLNTQHAVTGLERLSNVLGMDPAEVAKRAVEGASREGALGVIADIGKPDTVAEKARASAVEKTLRRALDLAHVHVMDVFRWDRENPSAASSFTGGRVREEAATEPAPGTRRVGGADLKPAKSAAELAHENMGLAVSIANEYRNIPGHDFDNVMGEARAALGRAAREFDPERKEPFSALAATMIRNRLNNLFNKNARIASREAGSIDDREAQEGTSAHERLADENATAPGAGMEREETAEALKKAMEPLGDTARKVLEGRLAGRSGEEIGRELGVSKQMVSKIEGVAREAVKRNLAGMGLRNLDADGVLYAGKLTDGGDEEEPKASTQINLHPYHAKQFTDFAAQIPDHELAGRGREDQPHVTARYGLRKEVTPEDVRKAVGGSGAVKFTTGKLSKFEGKDFDVLKADVASPGLHKLNERLGELPHHESDYPTYQPHVTIAYLRKGEADKYVGDDRFEGKDFYSDTLMHSAADDRTHTPIDLTDTTEHDYSKVPDDLMGFAGDGNRQKGYDEQNYPHVQPVRVAYPDMEPWVDSVKGMNRAHALERARRNWEGAEITPASHDELADAEEQWDKNRVYGGLGAATVEPPAKKGGKPGKVDMERDFFRAPEQTKLGKGWEAAKSAKDDWLKLAAPHQRGEVAKGVGNLLQGEAARRARQDELVRQGAKSFHDYAASLSKEDQRTLRDALEGTAMPKDARMKEMADAARNYDRLRMGQVKAQMQALGIDNWENFKAYQDYVVPHMFASPEEAQAVLEKSVQGGAGWLKHREIPTWQDVEQLQRDLIAEGKTKEAQALRPRFDNPAEGMFARWHQQEKFLMAQRIFAKAEASGYGHWRDAGESPVGDEKRIDQRIGTRMAKSTYALRDAPPGSKEREMADYLTKMAEGFKDQLARGTVPADKQDFVKQKLAEFEAKLDAPVTSNRKQYFYMPEAGARIIENYLSPGLRDKPWFNAYMGISNSLNQAQLGFSAFHAGFTAMDTMVSKLALALNQAGKGDIGGALKSALEVPISPILTPLRGAKLVKEWYSPGSQSDEVQRVVDAAIAGGWRAGQDSVYASQMTKRMMEGFRSGTFKGVAGGVLRAPFAAMEQFSRPIMEWLVPRMKAGVLADMLRMEMARRPGMTPGDMQEVASKAARSVDNRLGQMVY
ncbi:MAG TPA: sigma-70 family RNA polymerase sigma factor, partial [Chthoniobacteraceae bacterium]|nr:sigma-70 family RNA polymerase sigma factor [Chthoniobacteraceae bacterium]